MNRRGFLISSLILLNTTLYGAKLRQVNLEIKEWQTIKDIYIIIFPSSKKYNIQNYNPTQYLFNSSRSQYFPKEDLQFILNGARWFIEDNIISIEELIEKTSWGENWLAYLLNYALEGLYSDPIYNGNIDKIGWKMIDHNGGIPSPKTQYGEIL